MPKLARLAHARWGFANLNQNGELGKDKLINAIAQAKDGLFKLNQDNDDNLLKMRLFMTAHTLQCRYVEL